MAAYMCADLHLGHRAIGKYRKFLDPNSVVLPEGQNFQYEERNFHDSEEHDNYVEKLWLEMGLKTHRDTVYLLGDVSFTSEGWDRLDSWPGRKIIILGNHCTERTTIQKIASLKTVNSVHSMLKYGRYWLTHAPLHPHELRGKRNIHGHMHADYIRDRRYMCVSLEHTNMRPMHLDEIEAEFDRRKSLIHVHDTLGFGAAVRALL